MFQEGAKRSLLALLGLIVASSAACSPEVSKQNAVAPVAAADSRLATDGESRSGTQCPAQKFEDFLKAFANHVEIQRAYTRYPYVTTVYDYSDPEADPKVSRLAEGQVQFPVMLGDKDLLEHGANMHSERKAKDWYEVFTQSEGSGAYTMTFTFRYQSSCWFLTESIDAST